MLIEPEPPAFGVRAASLLRSSHNRTSRASEVAGQDAENAFTFGHDAMRRGWAGAAACVVHRIENDRRRSKEERSPPVEGRTVAGESEG
jgi:hypothetical protein